MCPSEPVILAKRSRLLSEGGNDHDRITCVFAIFRQSDVGRCDDAPKPSDRIEDQ